jgi:hypothetical protein
MIPRYQRILYYILVGAILLMTLVLIHGCVRNHQRILAMRDQSPIAPPADTPNEDITVALANDADGSVTLDQLSLALPDDPSTRARIILDRLLTNFSLPNSTHPVPPGPAVTDVFFVPLPIVNNGGPGNQSNSASLPDAQPVTPYGRYHLNGSQLAVVNLTKTFADAHPSGVEAEDLTLRAIIATLHSNFPQIEEVRFTVDGATRDTLAGHADLTRPYSVVDPVTRIHVLSPDGNQI